MAKVYYDQNSPFGSKVFAAIQSIKLAQANISRCRAMMDEITNNAANVVLLEGSKEFGVATGGGANFYNAMVNLQAALFAGAAVLAPGDLNHHLQGSIDLDQG